MGAVAMIDSEQCAEDLPDPRPAFIEGRKDLQMEIAIARKIFAAYQDRMTRLIGAPSPAARIEAATITAAVQARMTGCIDPLLHLERTRAMPAGDDALLTGWGESFFVLIEREHAQLRVSAAAIEEMRALVDCASVAPRPCESFVVIEGGQAARYGSSSAARSASQPARSEVQIKPPRITAGR